MFRRLVFWGVWLAARYLWFVSGFRWIVTTADSPALRDLQREAFWIYAVLRKTLPKDIGYVVILVRQGQTDQTTNLPPDQLAEVLELASKEALTAPPADPPKTDPS